MNALHNLGIFYADRGQDNEAFDYFKKSADLSDINSIIKVAVHYEKQKNASQVFSYYKLGADKLDARCQYELGLKYEDGTGIEKSLKIALDNYKLSADQGYTDAQNIVVIVTHYLFLKIIYQEAFRYFELTAKKNHAFALISIGDMYKNGTGVEKDLTKSLHYYKLAAMQRSLSAQLTVVYFYRDSVVKMDPKEYFKFLKLAADQNDLVSQEKVAEMYLRGEGVEKDSKMSFTYNKLIADRVNGSAKAQYKVGRCFELGLDVNVDMLMALKYYKLSAAQGNVDAQFMLGCFYRDGKANVYVCNELELAAHYFKLAADQGDAESQYFYANIKSDYKGIKNKEEAFKYMKLCAGQNLKPKLRN